MLKHSEACSTKNPLKTGGKGGLRFKTLDFFSPPDKKKYLIAIKFGPLVSDENYSVIASLEDNSLKKLFFYIFI